MDISHYHLTFVANKRISFESYPGSAFRGVFGHGLKEVSCSYPGQACATCQLNPDCAYPNLFENQRQVAGQARTDPHPFVLDFSMVGFEIGAHDVFTIGVTFLGRAGEHFDQVCRAWEIAGGLGVGKRLAKFDLVRVEEVNTPAYDMETLFALSTPACRFHLVTPFCARKRVNHRRIDIGPNEFEFGPYLVNILRRQNDLIKLYGDVDKQIDIKALTPTIYGLSVSEQALELYEYTRKSYRQDQYLKIRGVVGWLQITGEGLRSLMPYLLRGQWLHVGNNTIHGCGKYWIEPTAD